MFASALVSAPRYLVGATLLALCAFGCADDTDANALAEDAGQSASEVPSGTASDEPTELTGDETTAAATDAPSDGGSGPGTASDDGSLDDTGSEDTDGPVTEPATQDGGSPDNTSTAESGESSAAPDVDGGNSLPTDTDGFDAGSESSNTNDDDSTATEPSTGVDASAGDSGAGGEFDAVEDTALLDRPSTEAYACEVSTPASLLEVPSGFDGAVTGVGDTAWYARGEFPLQGGDPSLELSELGLDATLGDGATIGTSTSDGYSNTQIIATPEGLMIFSLKYNEQVGNQLYLAMTSLDGNVTRAAAPLTGLGGAAERYALALGTDEVALVFSRYTNAGSGLFFARVDFDGAVVGGAQLLRSDPSSIVPGAIAATSQGYVFSYVTGYQPAQLYALPIDGEGTLGTAVPLAENDNGLSNAHSMLPRGTEVLLAWTDTGGSWEGSDLDRTTILSRLDLDGQRVAKDVRVQSPVTSQERVSPKLLEREQDVGLLWSEGSVIYICGGCMPDNQLSFVMLDGVTLSPASEVVTLVNPAQDGGLINPGGWWRGDDLSVVAAVGYHVSGEGAAGTISCAQQ